MEVNQAKCGPRVSGVQIALGVLFVILGAWVVVKAAMTTHDPVSYVLGAVLAVLGVMRLRGKST